MKSYYLIVVFVLFSMHTWAQIILESDLAQAFSKAKSTQKDLLVYIVAPKCRKHPESCPDQKWLDSLLQVPEIAKALNQHFLVYEMNSRSQKADDQALISKIRYIYLPTFYFYSPDQERFAQFPFYNKIRTQQVLPQVLDTVAYYRALTPQRKALKQKIEAGQGSLEEIQYLIGLNQKIGITDPQIYGHYLIQNGELDEGLMEEIGECQCIEMDSPFFQTLLKTEGFDERFFLRAMIFQQVHLATETKDSLRFERALVYLSQINANTEDVTGGIALLTPNKAEQEEQVLNARFNFAVATQNAKNIGLYGEQQIKHMQKSYKQRKSDFMSESAWSNEGFEELNPSQPKISKAEREARDNDDFDKEEANIYNQIAWTIFENVQDKAILQKALAWSKTSLKWHRIPELLDTYANLLFALGKKEEAIQHEKEAIELLQQGYNVYKIDAYKKTLDKFLKE